MPLIDYIFIIIIIVSPSIALQKLVLLATDTKKNAKEHIRISFLLINTITNTVSNSDKDGFEQI